MHAAIAKYAAHEAPVRAAPPGFCNPRSPDGLGAGRPPPRRTRGANRLRIMGMSRSVQLPTIGWRERVDLPLWGLRRVRAKIDTGARTSVIDVAQVEEIDESRIRFEVVGRQGDNPVTRWIEATPIRKSVVRPSHGEAQERYVCLTPLRIGPHEYEIELSLVCRKNMLCRMLLGRRALEDRFLVDPTNRYVLTPRRRPPRRRVEGSDV